MTKKGASFQKPACPWNLVRLVPVQEVMADCRLSLRLTRFAKLRSTEGHSCECGTRTESTGAAQMRRRRRGRWRVRDRERRWPCLRVVADGGGSGAEEGATGFRVLEVVGWISVASGSVLAVASPLFSVGCRLSSSGTLLSVALGWCGQDKGRDGRVVQMSC